MHQRCHIFQYDYSQMKLIFILKTITEWRVWHVIGDISYEFKKNKKKPLFTMIEKKMKKKTLGQGIGYSEAGLTEKNWKKDEKTEKKMKKKPWDRI